MQFEELVEIVGHEPVFETSLLLAGDVDPADVQRQLSRCTNAGRIYQLRRGLYALAPPFQKVKLHPFLVANRTVKPSHVSLQSALAHYRLIPQYVPGTTSATSARPGRWDAPLGTYTFRHIKTELFHDYRLVEVNTGQHAFVASPEKALLDLVYLERQGQPQRLEPGAPAGLRQLARQALPPHRSRFDVVGAPRRPFL